MTVKANAVSEEEVKKDKNSLLVAVALGVAGVSLLFSAGTAFANVADATHERGFGVERQMDSNGQMNQNGFEGRHGDREQRGMQQDGQQMMNDGQRSQMREGMQDNDLNQGSSETLNVPEGGSQQAPQMRMNTNTGAS